ncbi:MAG: DNA-3-methyladenine glycosylase [Flavobacteriales bacterium]|nr:DNA-3-methyladenine glycosylase [Flavobacteriales bacterium]
MKLSPEFYLRTDVVQVARELLGKCLFSRVDGQITAGVITETEAYLGITDRASHAFGNRRTIRTETMYMAGGHSYVYLCYGIHSMFNVVTGPAGMPHAVLVRAIRPVTGLDIILHRRKAAVISSQICNGPGKVCLALGLHFRKHNGLSLLGNEIWIEDYGAVVNDCHIISRPRIGVDYAGDDALLPYRFTLRD